MPDPADAPAGAGALPRADAVKRVAALVEESDTIMHGLAYFGEDEKHWYYVAVVEREYKGNQYLNERYAQLVKPEFTDERDDTWKKNGINRRATDRIKEAATVLSYFYRVVAQRDEAHRASLDGRLDEDIDPEGWDILFVDVTEDTPDLVPGEESDAPQT
jgi:hypothetical protein